MLPFCFFFHVKISHSKLFSRDVQTDTSLAIESKFMKRWEFDSIAQAARCISSWFPGTLTERVCLREHLEAAIGTLLLLCFFFFG